MARNSSDKLYQLIRSLNRNEKRYCKLEMASMSAKEDKKIMLLFDAINDCSLYEEKEILKKVPGIAASQLPNLKGYLQDRILQSLRRYTSGNHAEIAIREQIDYAQLLFERRLFRNGLERLRKAKKLAEAYEKLELLLEIYRLEKNVLMDSIDQESLHKIDEIISEVQKINREINNINIFTNLSLKLDYQFAKIGTVRNEKDFLDIRDFLRKHLPEVNEENLSINERIHLYNLYVSYFQYIQDHENNYRYSSKLIQLFREHEELRTYRLEHYLKSLNGLLVIQYRLFRYEEFCNSLQELKEISGIPAIAGNENLKVRVLKYIYLHEINQFYMRGDFSSGSKTMVHDYQIEEFLKIMDVHSQLIFSYKIACLFFGAGNFSQAVKWLQKIINGPQTQIGEDLHCFARIMNLISHYELEHMDVINYYIISTYRFLLKKEDLHQFQVYIISFLRKLDGTLGSRELVKMFGELKQQLLPLKESRFDGRAFYYFDLISWLESKIEKKKVEEIIQRKFLERGVEV